MLKIFNSLGAAYRPQNKNENRSNTAGLRHTPVYFRTLSFKGLNLKPLEHDCVSFTSRKKQKDLPRSRNIVPQAVVKTRDAEDKTLREHERTITNVLAHTIYREAQRDTTRLKSTIKKSLDFLEVRRGQQCDKDHPIWGFEFRTKGPNSIREKASQKYLHSKEAVINGLGDIIGARIILGDGFRGSGDIIIDRLIETVKDGKLKITEVENHTPADKKYQYASQTKLHKLAVASADKYGILVSEKSTRNETGYTAIHLSVEFPDGYSGEIQILGRDVAVLKELEDVPYKILQGKSVHPEYGEIKEILSPLCPVDNNPDNPENIKRAKLKKEFIAYTAAAYKYEREKGPATKRHELVPEFLTIQEFARSQRRKIHLTPDMDFNNLYKIKSSADHRIKESKKE